MFPSPKGYLAHLAMGAIMLLFDLASKTVSLVLRDRNPRKATFRICQCRDCSAHAPIESIGVDFEERLIRIVVHRDFARHFEDKNRVFDEHGA